MKKLQYILGIIEGFDVVCNGFTQIADTLQFLSVSTRVESARLGTECKIGFNILSDDVKKLAALINTKSVNIQNHSKSLSILVRNTLSRFPLLVRIILSGQTDLEAFLSSSCIVHQFLSKPCDTELLKTTIERACALQNLLKDESLKKLVLQIESLPSQSGLYTEIREALQSPNISMGKIGQIIAGDIGMTAKVIQLVNSAFYGLRRRISSPTEAVVILGVNTIKALAFHHNPERCSAKTFTLVTAVHAADVLANEVYPVETGGRLRWIMITWPKQV